MRRMYSVKELTTLIKEVFDAELESGALDSKIADAVDAYLVEHPVDITALEGQTIAPAVVNATTSMSAPVINGESSPSLKPIYCHPLEIFKSNVCIMTALVFNNSSEQINTWDKLKTAIQGFGGASYNRLLATGGYVKSGVTYIVSEIVEYVDTHKFYINAVSTSGSIITDYILEITNEEFTSVVDSVNKIN